MVAPVPQGETAEAVFGSAAQLDSFAPSDLTDLLGALLASRPAFHADALCQEYAGRVDFFPEKGGDVGPAKLVCSRCLVKAECRAWAVEQGPSLQGVWAGTTGRQRRQMRSGVYPCTPDGSVTIVATEPPRRSTAA